MKNYDRNRKMGSIMESKPVLVLLGIVILVFAWSVVRFWNKMAETGRNKEIVENRALALRGQKVTLLTDLEKLGTDRGKEEFVRDNYGLAKEGEEVIVIVEDEAPKAEPPPSALSGFFSFIVNLFK